MKNWTNLHNHTVYSMLDGHGDIEKYMARAKSLGMSGLATTDHGNIHSWLDFYDAGQAYGVKPILGSEFYQARKTRFDRDEEERAGPAKYEWQQRGPYHVTILAKNYQGYQNIIKLSSRAFTEGYFVKPRIDHELISEHREGIIVLSGCLNGEVCQALLRNDFQYALDSASTMQEIVGKENYFIEIQNHGLEEQTKVSSELLQIANIIGAKVIPTGDCHYVHKEDARSHDIMLCQPSGTMVALPDGSSKKIEDIRIGDKVISWVRNNKKSSINYDGDSVIQLGRRYYTKDLVCADLSDGSKSAYTLDHICVSKIDYKNFKDKHVVYLLKKGNRYRLGVSDFYSRDKKVSILDHVSTEKADAGWILKVFATRKEAESHAYLSSIIFQIPDCSFLNIRKKQADLNYIWHFINDNSDQAKECLEHHGRDVKYPIWQVRDFTKLKGLEYVRACNLLDGMLMYSLSDEKKTGKWLPISISRKPHNGFVYSIEVEDNHTYIADGIVTHNCVGTNATIHTENRFSFSTDNFHLHSYEEMEKIFSEEWLKNTMHVNDMVELNLSFDEIHFPNFPIPTSESSTEYFERLAWEGLRSKYGQDLPEHIVSRANHEIKVVKEMGFPEYFLVVSDLVRWAKSSGIRVGWGRGSAAGSILSYAFEITNLDPIRFGLMFERFLVEGRKSLPDIDLDFDDRYREDVINYAREKYGYDHVAHICTFNKTGARQSIRDSARALGYEYIVGDKLSKLVPPPVLGVSKTLVECMEVDDFKKAYDSDEDYKYIVDTAMGLEGIVRQSGIHAAGVVISKDSLTEYLPIMQKGSDKPLVTQWDMGRVEQCGLLKIDFLGLRNLGVIDSCIQLVKQRRGLEIDLDAISLDDTKTFNELCHGNSIGVFQLESSSMRNMMVALQPRTVEDIMALISLHRPGPMGSGMDQIYIDRKHGRAAISYDHPKLKEVLDKSLGIMLYQEDVLAVSRELAGFSSAEADDLRKVIGKKQMDKIPQMRNKFVQGCKEFSDIPEQLGNKIFSDIEYFGGYGFNLSHAASYSMVSYVTAYLKANYPVEYMAALMSSVNTNKEKQSLYLSECRRMGIKVLPPSINKSEIDFTVVDDSSIIFGLSAINGIGYSVAELLMKARDPSRPYGNIHDFFRRCDRVILKKNILERLSYSGCLDELFTSSYEEISRKQELEILEIEKEALGIYVTAHPLDGIWNILSNQVDCEIILLSEKEEGSYVNVGGIISSVKPLVTKKGLKMCKLTLDDISSSVEVIVFPRTMKDLKDDFFQVGDIVILHGTLIKEVDEENAEVKLYYNSSEKIDKKIALGGEALVFSIPKEVSPKLIEKICDIIDNNNGNRPVFLQVTEEKHKYMYKFHKTTSAKVAGLIEQVIELESL